MSLDHVWDKEPEGFVGVKLGEPFAVSRCPLLPRGQYLRIEILDSNAMRSLEGVCHDTTRSTLPDAHVLAHLPQIGIGYRVTVHTKDGLVRRITIDWAQKYFDEMLSAFKSRYGSPTSLRSEIVKTNSGAEFQAAVVQWKGRRISINMYERLNRIDESYIVFFENATAEGDAEAQRARRASGAKQF